MQPHNSRGVERRFIYSISLTVVILVAEVIGGLWTGSLALLSDSAHVFMDIFALGLSFLALRLSSLPPDDRHSYGYHRLEVLAALANGLTLVIIALGIGYEAYQRWQNPQPILGAEMLVIAVIGLVANVIVAVILGSPSHSHAPEPGVEGEHQHEHGHEHTISDDLNLRSAFLHVIGDAVSSVGVIIAAIIVWQGGPVWVDPLVSVLIAVLILGSSYRVLRGSLHILIEGSPEGMPVSKVGELIAATPGVNDVHDLHVWNICSGHVALSAHVVVGDVSQGTRDGLMAGIKDQLEDSYGIQHTTIQFEGQHCGQLEDDGCGAIQVARV